jgi:hypothetical protein
LGCHHGQAGLRGAWTNREARTKIAVVSKGNVGDGGDVTDAHAVLIAIPGPAVARALETVPPGAF